MKNEDRVLEYLQHGNTLTAFDGFTKLGIVSVRDYISMLRKEGWPIISEWRCNLDTNKRWKEYSLTKKVIWPNTQNGRESQGGVSAR